MKDIIGYEGLYAITEKGYIWSYPKRKHKKGIWLKHTKGNNGYFSVTLIKERLRKGFRVHRLIANAFIPNPQNKLEINHINGIKTDNRIENLEWVTRTENILHSYRVLKNPAPGLGVFGKDHKQSKPFWIKFSDGKIKYFASGMDFERETGISSSRISNNRRIKKMHRYRWGDAKGLTVFFDDPEILLNESSKKQRVKLTQREISFLRHIKKLYPKTKAAHVARFYGVSRGYICNILNNKIYKVDNDDLPKGA